MNENSTPPPPRAVYSRILRNFGLLRIHVCGQTLDRVVRIVGKLINTYRSLHSRRGGICHGIPVSPVLLWRPHYSWHKEFSLVEEGIASAIA